MCVVQVLSGLGKCLPAAAVCLASPSELDFANCGQADLQIMWPLGLVNAKESSDKNAILASLWSLTLDLAAESQEEIKSSTCQHTSCSQHSVPERTLLGSLG